MPVMQQQMSHQMDQYHQMQQQAAPPSANHNLGNMLADSQYSMWQQDQSQIYMNNSNTYEQSLDPQLNYGVYGNDQGQLHSQNHQLQMQQQQQSSAQSPHMQSVPQSMQYQMPTQNQHHHMLNQQQHQQNQQQMFMMPPPYKSPSMGQQHQIMSSPTVNQSPHYIGPAENGTTSEDSDDSGLRGNAQNPLKRPSPEPLNESPSKVGKTAAANASTAAAAAAAKKPKAQRKKKKKDPNEPQKPVSAYALFFRDTQSAIKGQNPNASFGEVSTIVASMWDVLEPEHKDVYKKKQEAAKKDYLKTLAAYRASAVSKGSDAENQSTPGATSPQSQVPSQASQSSLPGQQSQPQQPSQSQTTPSMQSPTQTNPMQSPQQQSIVTHSPVLNQQNNTPPQFIQQQQSQASSLPPQNLHQTQSLPAHNVSPYQQQQQQYMSNSYKSPPQSNQVDYNNMSMQQMHPSHPIGGIGRPNANNSQQHYGYEQPSQHSITHNNMVAIDPYMNQVQNHGNLQVQHHQTSPMHPHHQPQHHHQQIGNCDNNLANAVSNSTMYSQWMSQPSYPSS